MQKPSNSHIRIAITTGDADGIGTEVAAKALAALGPREGVQFLWWRSAHIPDSHLELVDSKFSRLESLDVADLWELPFDHRELIDVVSDRAPATWVWSAANACLSGLCDALVTAPMSKTGQRDSGDKHLGHTEILAAASRRQELYMSFLGSEFGVVLATNHVPLAQVKKTLTTQRLRTAIDHALRLRDLMPEAKRKLPIAVVGLNPHAGEEGLIGDEEKKVFAPVLKKQSLSEVIGPLVPDAAFAPKQRAKYSVYVCPYHDQGLIPFKLVHGYDQGVHLTLGLPFVRTSVDHGTAKDLFGRDLAQAGSMIDAIQAALKLTQSERGHK